MEKSCGRISWEDLIFKNRNKEYGAYKIRKRYPFVLTISMFSSFLLAFVLISYLYIKSMSNQMDEYDELFENISTEMALDQLESISYINEIEPPKERKKIVNNNFNIIDTLIKDSVLSQKKNSLKEAEINKVDSVQPDSKLSLENKKEEKYQSDSIYIAYDLPKFPGGQTAFNKYVFNSVLELKSFKKNKIHGVAQVCFSIDEFGNPINIYTKKSINSQIDKDICEIFKKMPKWIPSENFNKDLKVVFTVPVVL